MKQSESFFFLRFKQNDLNKPCESIYIGIHNKFGQVITFLLRSFFFALFKAKSI